MNGINLLKKAKDDIDLAEKLIDHDQQHDNVGYHLAQAVEKIFKFICQQRNIKYLKSAKGHDLEILFGQLLEANREFMSYKNLMKLDVYQSKIRYDYLPRQERVDLTEMLAEIHRLLKEIERH